MFIGLLSINKKKSALTELPERFNSIDTLRGFASLSVVFWHWQCFFYQGSVNPGYKISNQPLYSIFFLFYHKGYFAVDLFFTISGFIFFWLYSEKISNKKITADEFFILRFSRLYPLHFVTLILVLLGQIISKSITGSYTVYPSNDLYHFVLNIFLISSWGFQNGFSFNAPIWSVSIEILLYIIFFYFSFFLGKKKVSKLKITFLLIIGAILLKSVINPEIYRGILSFFIGGSTLLLYLKFKNYYNIKFLSLISGSITVILWVISFISVKYNFQTGILKLFPNIYIFQKVLSSIFDYYAACILFPITILFLSLLETYKRTLCVRMRFIGDISYSSYLLHFPLILALILFFKKFNISNSYFYSNATLIGFFSILIILSFVSFYYFERPFQNFLRNKFLKKPIS